MRKLKIVVALVASLTLPASAVAGTVTFTDNFSPPATLLSNSSGNWTFSGGMSAIYLPIQENLSM